MQQIAECTIEASRLEKAAEVLKTVAHPVRLQIIDVLERGERTVSDLCRCLETAQPYTSQQLNLLKSKGILSARRHGNQVYYSIADPSVIKIIHCVRQQGSTKQGESGPEHSSGRLSVHLRAVPQCRRISPPPEGFVLPRCCGGSRQGL